MKPHSSVPSELVDSFFDRELNEGAKDQFFATLRTDLAACAEVAKTQRAISLLREPIESPDVSARVLAELSRRRRFLPERLRKMVTTGRLIAAGIILAFILSISVIDRVSPGLLRLTPRAHPVGGVVASSSEETMNGVAQLANAMGAVKVRPVTPQTQIATVESQMADGKRVFVIQSLKPGVTSARMLPKQGEGGLIVYRGAGPDSRFALPESVYIDKNAAIVLPLGHMSPSRVGSMDWAGVSRDNLFLLPAVEPDVDGVAGAASEHRGQEKAAQKRHE